MNARDAIAVTVRTCARDCSKEATVDHLFEVFRKLVGWYGESEPPAVVILGDGTLKRQQSADEMVEAIAEAFLAAADELRELHHRHVVLDANARYFLAGIAAAAASRLVDPEDQ